jgi:hypothetical protein
MGIVVVVLYAALLLTRSALHAAPQLSSARFQILAEYHQFNYSSALSAVPNARGLNSFFAILAELRKLGAEGKQPSLEDLVAQDKTDTTPRGTQTPWKQLSHAGWRIHRSSLVQVCSGCDKGLFHPPKQTLSTHEFFSAPGVSEHSAGSRWPRFMKVSVVE